MVNIFGGSQRGGIRGPRGPPGPPGPSGHGKRGPVGRPGPPGPEGPPGKVGKIGPQGERGDIGPQGEKGDRGADGRAGDKGEKGPKGDKGETGPQGERGLDGKSGPKGDAGKDGDAGPPGIQGPKGDAGARGERGEDGKAGPKGDAGPQGNAGPQGAQGLKGDTGPRGERGEEGKEGPKGDTGSDGIAGPQGDAGPQGVQGPKGDTGPQGERGVEGPKGDTGKDGAVGPQGKVGPQGIQGPVGPTNVDIYKIIPYTILYGLRRYEQAASFDIKSLTVIRQDETDRITEWLSRTVRSVSAKPLEGASKVLEKCGDRYAILFGKNTFKIDGVKLFPWIENKRTLTYLCVTFQMLGDIYYSNHYKNVVTSFAGEIRDRGVGVTSDHVFILGVDKVDFIKIPHVCQGCWTTVFVIYKGGSNNGRYMIKSENTGAKTGYFDCHGPLKPTVERSCIIGDSGEVTGFTGLISQIDINNGTDLLSIPNALRDLLYFDHRPKGDHTIYDGNLDKLRMNEQCTIMGIIYWEFHVE